jgi:hypothetical protein
MHLDRQADQMIGSDLEGWVIPSAAVPAATYHVKSNNDGTYSLASGAPTLKDALGAAGKFLDVVIDITVPNGGTVQVTIFGIDPASGKIFPTANGINQSTALAAAATTRLQVGPGLTFVANLTVNDFLPLYYGIQVVVATATVTLSLSGQMMP